NWQGPSQSSDCSPRPRVIGSGWWVREFTDSGNAAPDIRSWPADRRGGVSLSPLGAEQGCAAKAGCNDQDHQDCDAKLLRHGVILSNCPANQTTGGMESDEKNRPLAALAGVSMRGRLCHHSRNPPGTVAALA